MLVSGLRVMGRRDRPNGTGGVAEEVRGHRGAPAPSKKPMGRGEPRSSRNGVASSAIRSASAMMPMCDLAGRIAGRASTNAKPSVASTANFATYCGLHGGADWRGLRVFDDATIGNEVPAEP
jgi:hypothetical protein